MNITSLLPCCYQFDLYPSPTAFVTGIRPRSHQQNATQPFYTLYKKGMNSELHRELQGVSGASMEGLKVPLPWRLLLLY